jgi:hypothetical protein
MKRNSKNALLLCAMIVATGCGDNGNPGTAALAPLSGEARFAVVSSDFSSTSVAMLDADFQPLDESWINSGTTFPGLVATLSGDVVLPNRQAGDGTFALIDRFATDVVSRFYVPSGNLDGQVRTQGEAAGSGFSSNPQDFVFVDENSAWVPRYEQNLDPSAPSVNKGTDLLEIEPATMTLTGGRIDLSSLNTTAMVMTDEGPVEVDVFARPNRAVLAGSILIVGLDRVSANFDAAGPGMVAVVDLGDESVEGLLLGDGLKNCGNAVPVPGATNKVIVSCLGFAQVFGDEAATRASAGVVLLSVDAEGATIETTWRASTSESSAIAVTHLVALDETRVAGVALGDFVAETGDTLSITNLGTGVQQLVHESVGAFEIGISAYDPDTDMLFVPDGIENAVIEYAIGTEGATQVGSIQLAPELGLPPRRAYLLD